MAVKRKMENVHEAMHKLPLADKEDSTENECREVLYASRQRIVSSPAWVLNLPQAQDVNVKQLFLVACRGMDRSSASVSLHQRDENGNWQRILSTPGFVGKNGLCPDQARFEGCGKTPLGVYRFNKAFGIAPDPGCVLPYIQVDDNIYWSGAGKQHYNQMVNIKDLPDLCIEECEHLIDYEYEYRYCLNISFNDDGTEGRGSAIFLHCLGAQNPYTAGCVAIPENVMKLLMQTVHEDCVVMIDTMENMNVRD